MDRAEELLPRLIEAGYAARDDVQGSWWFTEADSVRAEELGLFTL